MPAVQDAPFFTVKLQIKTLPCLLLFSNGVAVDRVVGFDELGARDDFPTASLERRLLKSGVIAKPPKKEDSDEEQLPEWSRNIRRTEADDEDSDFD